MQPVAPRPSAVHPEASALARDLKDRFGSDAITAAKALRQFMLRTEQPGRATVYQSVIAILDGTIRTGSS